MAIIKNGPGEIEITVSGKTIFPVRGYLGEQFLCQHQENVAALFPARK